MADGHRYSGCLNELERMAANLTGGLVLPRGRAALSVRQAKQWNTKDMARWFLHHGGMVIQERTAGENLLSHAPGEAESRHFNQR
jgi:hypothetical protein